MSASYKKLWKILIDRDMNKSDLIKQEKITSNIVAKMGKGEDVS
ncbi:MAG: helix-turn-helix domain-containing protein, partial [Treponema sp.]|nr:helix-turn-helix domain-containing protein [Treponema sp.]